MVESCNLHMTVWCEHKPNVSAHFMALVKKSQYNNHSIPREQISNKAACYHNIAQIRSSENQHRDPLQSKKINQLFYTIIELS